MAQGVRHQSLTITFSPSRDTWHKGYVTKSLTITFPPFKWDMAQGLRHQSLTITFPPSSDTWHKDYVTKCLTITFSPSSDTWHKGYVTHLLQSHSPLQVTHSNHIPIYHYNIAYLQNPLQFHMEQKQSLTSCLVVVSTDIRSVILAFWVLEWCGSLGDWFLPVQWRWTAEEYILAKQLHHTCVPNRERRKYKLFWRSGDRASL